jgi:[ribosomal protein S5]-alanine N-acetyltransferase
VRLEGKRVCLRALTVADAPLMLALYEHNAAYLQPWDPVRTPRFYTLDYQAREIEAGLEAAARDQGHSFGIEDRATGALIGRLRLTNIVRGAFQNAYLGYWLDEAHAGGGRMTEAVGVAVGHAFATLRLHRVQAATLPHNGGSIRVLLKNGFRREGLAQRYLQIAGRWQDHVLFAVTAEEWPPRPAPMPVEEEA